MEIEELPGPDGLWWRFAVLAALGEKGSPWRFDPKERLLRYDAADGTRLRMQRFYRGRWVLWGTQPGGRPPSSWTGVPGWATSDAVHSWLTRSGATFLAWHTRDGWDTATPEADLAPILRLLGESLPEEVVAAAMNGGASLADLERHSPDPQSALAILTAARETTPSTQGAVRNVLAREIRAQMGLTGERDRLLPMRPVALVRWAQVARPPTGFRFAVHVQGDELEPAEQNSWLPDQFRVSLLNVLALLHRDEADDRGGWLFARVRKDGSSVDLERAFDSWPTWHPSAGPTLGTLDDEMARRTARWRPPWSRLLPRR